MNRPPFSGEAQWIWSHGALTDADSHETSPFRTCHFRRTFDAPAGAELTVYVSSDTEYVLYCNGERVRHGPAKGDISHHCYDTIELDEYLSAGENVIAALAVSYAPSWHGGPTSRMSATNAFVLDGVVQRHGGQEDFIGTDDTWRVRKAAGYGHAPRQGRDALAGANEIVDVREIPDGWTDTGFDDAAWQRASELDTAVRREQDHTWHRLPYRLVDRLIPPLEEKLERFTDVFDVTGISEREARRTLEGSGSVEIDAGEQARFVVDAGEVTTGYPRVRLSGGNGGRITLTYGEALHREGSKTPHHVPADGDVRGHWDRVIAGDGDYPYEPVSWRAFRYVDIELEAAEEPLTLDGLDYRFTGYPFEERATFDSSAEYDRLWEVAWRTVRRCAHETFEDCPYYEQLQYAGDTQPVMRFAGYVSGDWQLGRQAVYHFDWSRDDTGLSKSRYPSRIPQQIPSWSLLWVRMVRDYWWFTGDEQTATDVLPGVDATLEWFHRRTNDDGMAAELPHWKCVDWSPDWTDPGGVPPGAIGGVSAVINLQYAAALRNAATLHHTLGDPAVASRYEARADHICTFVNETCWDDERGWYVDRPNGTAASELGNAWAVLSGAATGERAEAAVRSFGNPELARAAWYGRYYLFRAASEADCYGAVASDTLAEYDDRIADTDLTTLPERYGNDCSYCHAWSAAPLYEFLGEVLGIKADAAGFESVLIAPQPLELEWASGAIPTAAGEITVDWRRDEEFVLSVETPMGVGGRILLPGGEEVSIPESDREVRVSRPNR